jgi:nucleoside-diphosphate-sugar epimerase
VSASTPRRVLVTGATGLIGGRLCEVMALTGVFESRPLVHSTASAWRIARFPLHFAIGDVCDYASVDRAMVGCDAVVHLARGDGAVMRRGLENVLRAAVRHGVARFVHVSSVAVYGSEPPPDSVSETARVGAGRCDLPYGRQKLEQERRVLRCHRRHGLDVVILRPPNVYGPFAAFNVGMIGALRSHEVAIVDDGRNPCNLVYVDNLVEAILLALWTPDASGQVFHVTDPEPVSWEQCITDHARLAGVEAPRIAAAELVPALRERVWRDSLRAVRGMLGDAEFRRLAKRIPFVRRWFQSLPEPAKRVIRRRLHRWAPVQRNGSPERRFRADHPLIAPQKRMVAHSSAKARRLLGLTAPVSYDEAMRLTEGWLREARVL